MSLFFTVVEVATSAVQLTGVVELWTRQSKTVPAPKHLRGLEPNNGGGWATLAAVTTLKNRTVATKKVTELLQ